VNIIRKEQRADRKEAEAKSEREEILPEKKRKR
jgi:hypothetical protein